MTPTAFLADLTAATHALQRTVQTQLAPLGPAALNRRPAPTAWSAFECLEHLNRYARHYLPALQTALATAPAPTAPTAEAAVGYSWLGRKSVAMMRPANAKKQAALARLNPAGSPLDHRVLAEFGQHQTQLLALLAQAAGADLNRKAVPVEFFRLLKLRLGEALEFVVVHEQRHVAQALRAAGV